MSAEREPDIGPVDLRPLYVQGRWCDSTLSGQGALRLGDRTITIEVASGEARAPYGALDGAEYRAGTLTLHAKVGQIMLRGHPALDAAWGTLVRRACTLPELTTALRALGSRRGGDAALQQEFFGPLLVARRKLEEQEEIEWRLTAFDGVLLRDRVLALIASMATERHATDASARRALTACLEDEAEPLLHALDDLADAAHAVREASDAERFAAWRAWTARAKAVFEQADRAWLASAVLLQGARTLAPEPIQNVGRRRIFSRRRREGPR